MALVANETAAATATRLPWSSAVAGLIALGTLSLTDNSTLPIAAALAAALIGTYFSPWRLESGTMVRWFVRITMIFGLFTLTRQIDTSGDQIGPIWIRSFFGLISGGEMVVQAWRARSDNPRAPLLLLFLSGIVFMIACNTFEDRFVRFIAPAYMLCVALGLRAYRRHAAPTDGAVSAGVHGAALALALALGFGGYHVFQIYRGEITDWGNRLLGQHRDPFDTSLMAEQPMLGPTFGLGGSTERVLRLTGVNGGVGYSGDAHLRGMSFDVYETGRWSPTVSERHYLPLPDPDLRVHPAPGEPPIGIISIVRVTRLAHGNTLIYAPLNATEIDLTGAEGPEWAPESGGPIRTISAPPFIYTLGIPTREPFQGILAGRLTGKERAACLHVPRSLNPNVEALARSVVGRRRGAEQKIAAVVDYLIARHHYSLTVNPGPGDPVSGFLLSDPPKDAHCEYFASSAALLLRCVGVPTRYVTGYYAHESEGPNSMLVRQRDAHAWVEAWVDGTGWETVDATPGDGRPDYQPAPISPLQALQERLQDAFQTVHDWLGDLKPDQVNVAVGSLTVIILGGGAIWLVLRRRRRMGLAEGMIGFLYSSPSEELAALAAKLEREMARRGEPLPQARTWREHLATMAIGSSSGVDISTRGVDMSTRFRELAQRFVSRYEQARFGALESDAAVADALSELERLLAEMEAEPQPAATVFPASKGDPNQGL